MESLPTEKAIRQLLAEEGNDRLAEFMSVRSFDEVPLYSRVNQIARWNTGDIAATNCALIQAAVEHLTRIVTFAATTPPNPGQYVAHMVTVTGWWDTDDSTWVANDGHQALLLPNFWIGNFSNPALSGLVLLPPSTACGQFVLWALADRDDVQIYESSPTETPVGHPRRVYVDWNHWAKSKMAAAEADRAGGSNLTQ